MFAESRTYSFTQVGRPEFHPSLEHDNRPAMSRRLLPQRLAFRHSRDARVHLSQLPQPSCLRAINSTGAIPPAHMFSIIFFSLSGVLFPMSVCNTSGGGPPAAEVAARS
jgi:hypothetical protein